MHRMADKSDMQLSYVNPQAASVEALDSLFDRTDFCLLSMNATNREYHSAVITPKSALCTLACSPVHVNVQDIPQNANQSSPWVDLDALLERLHNSAPIDECFLDSLPPISGIHALQDSPEESNVDDLEKNAPSLWNEHKRTLGKTTKRMAEGYGQKNSLSRNKKRSAGYQALDHSSAHCSSRKAVRTCNVSNSIITFRTRSNVDILDDGFEWDKYGQKKLTRSIYPRNYYRCSRKGCHVHKHIQRCSSDASFVDTTYKGTHNHPCPFPLAQDGSATVVD